MKYGARQYLKPMLREGTIRVCHASYYNGAGHNVAVRDGEISRVFCIPT